MNDIKEWTGNTINELIHAAEERVQCRIIVENAVLAHGPLAKAHDNDDVCFLHVHHKLSYSFMSSFPDQAIRIKI
jgi:hypothetical protein